MSVFDVLVIGTKHTSSTPVGRRQLASTQPQARPEDNGQEASLSPGSGSGMSYLGSEAGLIEFLEMVPLAGVGIPNELGYRSMFHFIHLLGCLSCDNNLDT